MTPQTPNRISGFFDDPSAPVPRTPAQQDSARRNGRLGRGPITQAGKDRSRMNALRHGILARAFCPPADYRGDSISFRKILQQLLLDFPPQTAMDRVIVEGLAHDLVMWQRAKQFIEFTLVPMTLSPQEQKTWVSFINCRKDLAIVNHAREVISTGGRLGFDKAHAEQIAKCIADQMQALDRALIEDQDPELEPLTEEDLKLRLPRNKLLEALGPSRRKFADVVFISSILVGKRNTPGQLKKLEVILEYAAVMRNRWLDQHHDIERRTSALTADSLGMAVQNIERLTVLGRYQTAIERAIERKLVRLEGR